MEDNADVTANLTQLCCGDIDHVLTRDRYSASRHRHQSDDRAADGGFPRTRFTNKPQHLAGINVDRDVFRGAERGNTSALRVSDVDVGQREDGGFTLVLIRFLTGSRTRSEVWDGGQQFLGVVNLGSRVDIDRCAGFDDPTSLHDDHVVRHIGNNPHVVGNQNDSRTQAFIERPEKVEDFGLNRHIERSSRLVGDEDFGVTRDGLRDHRALSLTTRQLVRIRIERLLRVGQFDEPE